MNARQNDDDEGRTPARGEDRSAAAYPLVLPEGRKSLIRRLVGPLRALLEGGEGGEAAVQDAPPGEAAERAGVEVTGRSASALPRTEGAGAAGVDQGGSHAVTPVHRATLQLLPGRLQPIAPSEFDQEVRFVRTGPRETEVTLGWKEAAPPSHVRLDHPSLQPLHARMRFRDDEWLIESMSEKAPVRVNDATIAVGDGPRPLANGDRVRMGDVEFEFRWP